MSVWFFGALRTCLPAPQRYVKDWPFGQLPGLAFRKISAQNHECGPIPLTRIGTGFSPISKTRLRNQTKGQLIQRLHRPYHLGPPNYTQNLMVPILGGTIFVLRIER